MIADLSNYVIDSIYKFSKCPSFSRITSIVILNTVQ